MLVPNYDGVATRWTQIGAAEAERDRL